MDSNESTNRIIKNEVSPAPAYVKLEKIDSGVKCHLCLSNLNDPIKYGDFYKLEGIVCHYFCLVRIVLQKWNILWNDSVIFSLLQDVTQMSLFIAFFSSYLPVVLFRTVKTMKAYLGFLPRILKLKLEEVLDWYGFLCFPLISLFYHSLM